MKKMTTVKLVFLLFAVDACSHNEFLILAEPFFMPVAPEELDFLSKIVGIDLQNVFCLEVVVGLFFHS